MAKISIRDLARAADFLDEINDPRRTAYGNIRHKLADISDYYNFAGINDISVNSANFDDVFHHNIETGDLVIDTIVNGSAEPGLLSQGFGVLVTKENVDGVLKNIIVRNSSGYD